MKSNEFTSEMSTAWNHLQEHPLGTLATINKMGLPELATVYLFVENDFTCYFVTKTSTRKFQNLLMHADASILSYDENELTSVELAGKVEVITDASTIIPIIEKFQHVVSDRKAGYWIPPISQLDAGQYAVCKLVPTAVQVHIFAKKPNDPLLPKQLSFNPQG